MTNAAEHPASERGPDFDALALSRPWPREAWVGAWSALDSRIPWDYLVEFVDAGQWHPVTAADRLTRALKLPPLTRSGIQARP